MEWSVFLSLPQGLRVTEVSQEEASLLIQVISEQVSACCPLCGQSSDTVHSRYRRQLKDVPAEGRRSASSSRSISSFATIPNANARFSRSASHSLLSHGRRRPSISRKRFSPSVSRHLEVWVLGLRLAWESEPPG